MSLLTLCQQVASSIPLAVPTAIVGQSDDTAILLLACAQDEGEALSRKPSAGWLEQQVEYDFTTVAFPNLAGTLANTGAGGVGVITGLSSTTGIAAKTFYVTGTNVPANTTVASVDSGTQVTLTQAGTGTGAGTFTFAKSDYALPSDYNRLVMGSLWDRSRYWEMRGPLSPHQWQLYKSSIIGRSTILRRWRVRRIASTVVLSIDPAPTDNGAALVFEYVTNAWCQSASGTAQTKWAADTDTGIIDEYLMRLGVKWRMLRRLGMAYQDEMAEYLGEVDKAIARNGGAPVIPITGGAWDGLSSPGVVLGGVPYDVGG